MKVSEVMITGAFSGAKMLVQIDKYWGSCWCMHQFHDAKNDVTHEQRNMKLVCPTNKQAQ